MTLKDLKFYTPTYIPEEILAYDSELLQLKTGNPGKIGALELNLEENQDIDKTVIKHQYAKVPLFTKKALYIEESLPSMAYVYIMNPSGGMLQGDRYRMDIRLSKNAKAHITTQGATRIYKMERNFATQMVNIFVDDGCYLEYIPDQIIPYEHSCFFQKMNLKVHDKGTFVYSEIVTPGRVASGELFEYDIIYMTTEAKNHEDRMKFVDVYVLEPKKNPLNVAGVLDNYHIFGSLYILTTSNYLKNLLCEINKCLLDFPNIRGGATILPNDSGIVVRFLGNISDDLKSVIYEIVNIIRKQILGAVFSGIRKY